MNNWSDGDFVRRQNPDAIVMHASAFHQEEHNAEAVDKSQALIESFMSLPKAQQRIAQSTCAAASTIGIRSRRATKNSRSREVGAP